MKKEAATKKNKGEKKIQIGIGVFGRDFDDTELRDGLDKLDNSLKDIDDNLKSIGVKFEKI